jgi:hypothetical protein
VDEMLVLQRRTHRKLAHPGHPLLMRRVLFKPEQIEQYNLHSAERPRAFPAHYKATREVVQSSPYAVGSTSSNIKTS